MKPIKQLTLILGITVLFAACSDSGSITGPTSTNQEISGTTPDFQYPPVEEAIANLPAGYRIINMEQTALDNCDSVTSDRWARAGTSTNLNSSGVVKIYIGTTAMPYSATIRIVRANSCLAVADFYPHPFQFNQMVEIRWTIADLNLPAGVGPADLVPWYITDSGDYVQVQWGLSSDQQFLSIWTDHFSRYIVTQRVNG